MNIKSVRVNMYKRFQIGKNTFILSVERHGNEVCMRRRKNSLRKERIIMISASAFVLTALTMAGVYVRDQSKDNDEYRVDLSELSDNSVADKTSEIAEHLGVNEQDLIVADDLDADPDFWEVDSPGVEAELSHNTDEKVTAKEAGEDKINIADNVASKDESASGELAQGETDAAAVEAGAEDAIAANYNFPNQMQLTWPLNGDIIMNYSMDKTLYFETLGQYRYNPALVIDAEVGTTVAAAANGVIKEVYNNAELGNVVVMDIGDGYELTYGQLDNVSVQQGSVVEAGTVLGTVAEPSVYYSSEGSNLYLKLTKDGVAVNPMDVLP